VAVASKSETVESEIAARVMTMGVLVEPKMGSYVTEWEAVQFDASDFRAFKKLARGSSWAVQLLLTDEGAKAVFTSMVNGSVEQWFVAEGEWAVKSPHGRFWFMDDREFRSQFHVWDDGKAD
jgi:hypothetical protein